jgi:anaerobic ribonucleoside-triphosphate reductase
MTTNKKDQECKICGELFTPRDETYEKCNNCYLNDLLGEGE